MATLVVTFFFSTTPATKKGDNNYHRLFSSLQHSPQKKVSIAIVTLFFSATPTIEEGDGSCRHLLILYNTHHRRR